MNTAAVSLAVTPAVVSTLLSHYTKREPRRQKPTAHLSYDEGLHLIRTFLKHASHHTVEELQAFTSQWVPHPQWVKVEEVVVPDDHLARAATLIEEQLGPDGIRRVGGRSWWQWRKPNSPLKAEWVEMRADYHERKRSGEPLRRVMLYVHGGAYYFGSVDEHRYQIQRHARKLKARVLAPRYRLSPQFPFPCGLQDCLAAYLHLLALQDPSTIVVAGDSAGGGMLISMMVILRDQGIPLPAGAILISPWVDQTHSFPSVAADCPFDYIPDAGFHHKPSPAWPPPTTEELEKLAKLARKKTDADSDSTGDVKDVPQASPHTNRLHLTVDGREFVVREQVQLYTTNDMLTHPLVSPIMQPTLGGLPPLLVMVGGGEHLRDEQIYLAHKCANPSKYLPVESLLDDKARAAIKQYKPTDVQLQVWEDLCHVAPTLSFTRPAKHMYRSVAQFGAWALARAQKTDIDILDDDEISVISSSSSSETEEPGVQQDTQDIQDTQPNDTTADDTQQRVGRAGDPLPRFKNHMIRQRVTRHGVIFPLAAASELAACTMPPELLGIPKQGPVSKWLTAKHHWDTRYASTKARVQKRRAREARRGYETFGPDEHPPPSALAGRRPIGADMSEKKKRRSYGLSLWSLWGSKHDEATVVREQEADREPAVRTATAASGEGSGARPFADIEKQETAADLRPAPGSRSRSRRRIVRDESQTEWGWDGAADADTPAAELLARREEEQGASDRGQDQDQSEKAGGRLLSPDYAPDTGVTGKRPFIDGIAMPFSLGKEADTASMVTLTSALDPSSQGASAQGRAAVAAPPKPGDAAAAAGEAAAAADEADAVRAQRPPIETFVTAAENLPRAGSD